MDDFNQLLPEIKTLSGLFVLCHFAIQYFNSIILVVNISLSIRICKMV